MEEQRFTLSKEFEEFLTNNEDPWDYQWMPCPRCGSRRVVFRPKVSGPVYILQLTLWVIVTILTGIIPGLIWYVWRTSINPHPMRDLKCKDCNLQWSRSDLMSDFGRG